MFAKIISVNVQNKGNENVFLMKDWEMFVEECQLTFFCQKKKFEHCIYNLTFFIKDLLRLAQTEAIMTAATRQAV